MSLSVLLAALWVLAATVTAFLPMRWQLGPGGALLAAAPVVMVYLAIQHGPLAGLIALAGVVSMFRKPLQHLWRKGRGLEKELAE